MVKFVKELLDQAKKASLAKKMDLFWKAKSLGKQTTESMYSIYFWAIDGFASGKPSGWQVEGFKFYVIPGIDTEFNLEAKKRCQEILKNWKQNKVVLEEDVEWILKELRPYFENSMVKQVNKTIDALQAVDEGKMEEFMRQAKKQKKGLYK